MTKIGNTRRDRPRLWTVAVWLLGGALATGGLSAEGVADEPAPKARAEAADPRSQAPAGEPAAGLSAAPLLDAPLQDLDDQPVSLRALRGRVVVVLHQDRHSSAQNASFKDRLGQLALRHRERIIIVALADVGGYNFWPARGYVKDALRPLRANGGAIVACDWHSTVQKKYRLPARQSSVFVVTRNGSLAVLEKGVLPGGVADALLSQIEKLALD